jgi:hypothetical protein
MLLLGLAPGAGDRLDRGQAVPVRLTWSLDIFNAIRFRMGENGIVVLVHGLPPLC